MFWSKRSDPEPENKKAAAPAALPAPAAAPARAAGASDAKPQVTAEAVREVLRQNVHDPEIGINIVDMGLVYDIQIADENKVNIKMTLTSPGCPVGPQIIGAAQTYTKRAFPDLAAINVHITWDPMWSPELMTQEAKDQLGFF